MMFNKKLVLTAGVSCGHVTFLKSCQPVAPSTEAASLVIRVWSCG